MGIQITRQKDEYWVVVTPTGRLTRSWSNSEPLDREDLVARLAEIGYHLQDIADALYLADIKWDAR